MQTIQHRKSRIWEIKEDKYTKSLAKNQVYAIFQMRDIRKKSSHEITEFIIYILRNTHQKAMS